MKKAKAKYNVGYEITEVELKDLFPASRIFYPDLLERVKDSINNDGLYYPLVCNVLDWSTWEKEWKQTPILNPPPDVKQDSYIRVYCGNNRLEALKQLGYTHADCIICDSRFEAEDVCIELKSNIF